MTTTIQAGHDLLVSASNVVSTNQTTLQARNDSRIESDVETLSRGHSQSTKKSGLMSSGGIGVTLGSSKNTATQSSHSQTQKGSTVGSVLGDVNITAGKSLTIQASDAIAGGDINLAAQNVKQTNVSGGASFTFGSMAGGGSLSVSQDKIKSNFDSVQEQAGLYAGKGGFQVNVGGQPS